MPLKSQTENQSLAAYFMADLQDLRQFSMLSQGSDLEVSWMMHYRSF